MKINPQSSHLAIRPQVLDNAAGTSYVLDLQEHPGAKGVLWKFFLGAIDVAPSVMKIQEDDAKDSATALTAASDVHDFTSKPGTDADGGIYAVFVPCDGRRERYQQAAFTAGDGTNGIAVCVEAQVIGGDNAFDATDLGFTVFEEA